MSHIRRAQIPVEDHADAAQYMPAQRLYYDPIRLDANQSVLGQRPQLP